MNSLVHKAMPASVGIGGFIILSLIVRFAGVFSFAALSIAPILLLLVFYRRMGMTQNAGPMAALLLATWLAGLGLLSIAEGRAETLSVIIFSSLSLYGVTRVAIRPHLSPAEWQIRRRFLMMLMTFDTYALMTSLFALNLFFPAFPAWLMSLLGSLLAMSSAGAIWRLYGNRSLRQILPYMAVIGVLVAELMWATHFLPFEYGAFGLFITWFWYLTQLFLRWHMSPAGVIWRKQTWFLLSNLLLMIVILVWYVRWV